jgi:hypothetical protein
MLGGTIQQFGFNRDYPEVSLRNICLKETQGLSNQKKIFEELLSAKFDWQKFVQESISERIGGLIYYNLNKSGLIDILPEFVKEAFLSRYCFVLNHNKMQTDFFKAIISDLENISAPIALKGIVFSHTVYEDPALREHSDIDLLIEKKDFFEVDKMLTQKWKMKSFLDCPRSKTYELDNYAGGFSQKLDLIWDLAPIDRFSGALNFDTPLSRRNSQQVLIQDKKVNVLSWEDAIIYSVYHLAFHHRFNGVIWHVDLLKIINKFRDVVAWDKLGSSLKGYALSGVACSIFKALQEQLGCQIDYSQLNNLKRGIRDDKINNISKNYLEDKKIVLGGLRNEIKMAFLFDRLVPAYIVLFRLIFPSYEWLEFNFSRQKNYLNKEAFSHGSKILRACFYWFCYLNWSIKTLLN